MTKHYDYIAIGGGGSARVYIDKPGRFLQLSLALEQVGGALSVYGGSARSPERMAQRPVWRRVMGTVLRLFAMWM